MLWLWSMIEKVSLLVFVVPLVGSVLGVLMGRLTSFCLSDEGMESVRQDNIRLQVNPPYRRIKDRAVAEEMSEGGIQ